MAFMFARFGVQDYDAWKERFDSDPVGRKEGGAKGHQLFRSATDPNDVFIAVEFPSADQASSFREKLLGSGILDDMNVKTEPTVVEAADSAEY
jgi:hypothetical protein